MKYTRKKQSKDFNALLEIKSIEKPKEKCASEKERLNGIHTYIFRPPLTINPFVIIENIFNASEPLSQIITSIDLSFSFTPLIISLLRSNYLFK